MLEYLLPYPLALRMKRLGFNHICQHYYDFTIQSQTIQMTYNHNDQDITRGKNCSAPTFAQCFKWFRDNYQIQGIVGSRTVKRRLEDVRFSDYVYEIRQIGESSICSDQRDQESDTYEEAELECLIKIIEIVEKIKKDEE